MVTNPRGSTTGRHTAQAGIPYAAAFRFHRWRLGLLDHPLSRMMTADCFAMTPEYDSAISPRVSREVCH
jgi:hypothetical protein